MDSNAKKHKYEILHCHHCNREVSKSTWYKHYEKYFDSVSGKWRTEEKFSVQANNFNDRTSTLIERAVMIRVNWRGNLMMLSLFQKTGMKLPVM